MYILGTPFNPLLGLLAESSNSQLGDYFLPGDNKSYGKKKKKQKRDTGRWQARGGVPISNRVVREGLSDNITLTKDLQK